MPNKKHIQRPKWLTKEIPISIYSGTIMTASNTFWDQNNYLFIKVLKFSPINYNDVLLPKREYFISMTTVVTLKWKLEFQRNTCH